MTKAFDIETITRPGGIVPVNLETTAELVRHVIRLREAIKQVQQVCDDNAADTCDHGMALKFVRSVTAYALRANSKITT